MRLLYRLPWWWNTLLSVGVSKERMELSCKVQPCEAARQQFSLFGLLLPYARRISTSLSSVYAEADCT